MSDEATVGLGDALQMATRNGECFGGTDGWLWIVVLFLLIGGNGFGNNKQSQSQPVTEAGLCSAMNFNDLQNQVGRMNDLMQTQFMQTSQGLASVGYENLRNFSQTQDAVKDGNYALSSQLSDCCCTTQRAIDGVNFNAAQNTASINANMTAQTQKVLDAIAQNKIDTLQARVNQLEMQNAMCGVVRYPNATTYTAGPGPYCGSQCF